MLLKKYDDLVWNCCFFPDEECDETFQNKPYDSSCLDIFKFSCLPAGPHTPSWAQHGKKHWTLNRALN